MRDRWRRLSLIASLGLLVLLAGCSTVILPTPDDGDNDGSPPPPPPPVVDEAWAVVIWGEPWPWGQLPEGWFWEDQPVHFELRADFDHLAQWFVWPEDNPTFIDVYYGDSFVRRFYVGCGGPRRFDWRLVIISQESGNRYEQTGSITVTGLSTAP